MTAGSAVPAPRSSGAMRWLSPEALSRGLTRVLLGSIERGNVVIHHRQRLVRGTSPKEIVACTLPNGTELRILCKYEAPDEHRERGHRRGVAYEIAVYRDLLRTLSNETPKFYGSLLDRIGQSCLVLEYLDGSTRVNKSEDPDALRLAAQWIGEFHATLEGRVAHVRKVVTIYDAKYFVQWSRRTRRFAARAKRGSAWVSTLATAFESLVDELAVPPLTLIHGEYYPKNLLIRGRTIYPLDWESAALSAGEIDLACLTDLWPERMAAACVTDYQSARWRWVAPEGFQRRLDIARLYTHFRWLGSCPGRPFDKTLARRLEPMHAVGRRLGVIP